MDTNDAAANDGDARHGEMPTFLETPKPKLEFEIGGELWLEFDRHDAVRRVPTHVRGWVDNTCFFVETPQDEDGVVESRKDERVTVRCVLGGVLYAFTTTFERKIMSPCDLWCLLYPEVVQTRELRRQPRTRTLMPVSFGEQSGLIVDLSTGGALIDLRDSHELRAGDKLTLNVTLPTGEQVSGLPAEVRQTDSGSVGVAFDGAHDGIEAIRKYLAASVIQPAAEAVPEPEPETA